MSAFCRSLRYWSVLAVIAGCWQVGPAVAEPIDLADILPQRTVIYIGRSGSDQTADAARDTAFGKTLADPQVDRFTQQIWTCMNDLLAPQFPRKKGAKQHAALKRVLETLAQRPAAIAIIDGVVGDQGPFLEAAFLCHPGKNAKSFLRDVDTLFTIQNVPSTQPDEDAGHAMRRVLLPVPGGIHYGLIKDYFVLAVGERTVEAIAKQINGGESSLAKSTAMASCRKKIGGDAGSRIISLFINIAGATKRIKTLMPGPADGEETTTPQRIIQALESVGMDSLRSICWEMHYRDRGCYSGLYFETPGRGGAHSTGSPAKPLPEEVLALIPRSPSWAAAIQIDLAGLYRRALSLVETMDKESYAIVRKQVDELDGKLGLSIKKDLLELIGPVVVIYDAPENGGLWFTGTTAFFESSDPKRLQGSLAKIVKAIGDSAGDTKVGISSISHGDHRVEFVNVAAPIPVAPAWAIHDKWLVVGLYPQMVTAALDRLTTDPRKNSILANADFLAAKRTIGDIGESFTFADTKAGLESAYPLTLLAAQIAAGAAQSEGARVDISAFPSRSSVTRHLFADIGTMRSDADGVLYASYGPLPIGVPSLMSTSTATGATLVSVLLPSLSRARELSKRTVCAANLHGIGHAMYIHAQEDNNFPPDLETLVKENNASEKQFICPSSDARPGDLHACYEYVPGQTISSAPYNVLVYEKPGCHQGEGGNVLFQDSHVEFVKPYSRVEQLVKETKERLAKEKASKTKNGE